MPEVECICILIRIPISKQSLAEARHTGVTLCPGSRHCCMSFGRVHDAAEMETSSMSVSGCKATS